MKYRTNLKIKLTNGFIYMKKITIYSSLMLTILISSNLANAQAADSKFAITGKVGTLGLGLDATYNISDKLNARLNLNGGNINRDDTIDGIRYEGELQAGTFGGLLDYHPMAGGFRLTGGVYNNSNELNLNATGAGNTNAQIGDRFYDLSNSRLNTNVSFQNVAPYLGIGWGNAIKTGSKWRFNVDAGVLFQGSPKASLTASGIARDIATNQAINLATDATFQSELTKEEQNLNNELKDYKFYPVISLGVSYRF